MSPISYQGPMEADEKPQRTHSQSRDLNLGIGQPGLTVESILSDKGHDVYTVTPHISVMYPKADHAEMGFLHDARQGRRMVGGRGH